MMQYDLSEVFQLFGLGVGFGVALAFFPFIIGFGAQSLYSLIKKA